MTALVRSTTPTTAPLTTAPPTTMPASSLAHRLADILTVVGVALAPIPGFGVGGAVAGVGFADFALALAVVTRGYQFMSEGVRTDGLRRQSVLLAILGVFSLSGLVSELVMGVAPTFGYVRSVFAAVATVFLVATYGAARRVEPLLVQALVFGCVVLAVSGFLPFFATIHGRAIGLAIHPNSLGHSCLLGIAAAVWLVDNARTPRARGFWAVSAAICFAGLLNSGSRGGTLGLFVAATLYLLLRRNVRYTLLALALGWIGFVVLASGAVDLPDSNPIQRFITESSTDTGANEARRQELELEIDRITARPILGEGFEDVLNVHAVYLQAWIGAGVVGAAMFVLLGGTMVLMPFWQRKHDLALACGLAAIAVAWAFTNIFSLRDQWVYIAIAFGASPSPLVMLRRSGDQ